MLLRQLSALYTWYSTELLRPTARSRNDELRRKNEAKNANAKYEASHLLFQLATLCAEPHATRSYGLHHPEHLAVPDRFVVLS